MVRILAVADEVDPSLNADALAALRPDLIVACGDLPFDHLEYLVTSANVPLLYVRGNHDPEVRPRGQPRPGVMAGLPALVAGPSRGDPEGASREPAGCASIDGAIVEVRGLRFAGLGGSHRYSNGPNQYTQREMRRRARWLELRSRLSHPRRGIDVLVTHAPPLGVGDDDDPCHRGFAAFHRVVRTLRPTLLVHGHIHPYGQARPDRSIGPTRVVNVIPRKLLEVTP